MGTPYESIFDVFLGKIEDPLYTTLDIEVAEADLLLLLNSAILNFEFPRVSLYDKDDTDQEFDNTLDFETIQLLGHLMQYEWLKRQLRSLDSLKQTMSPLEFRSFSQANHINSLLKIEEKDRVELEKLKKRYSRRDLGVTKLTSLGGE